MRSSPRFACPKCRSTDLHRSRSRNWTEQLRKELGPKRPFRCAKCQWRGWLDANLYPLFPASQGVVPTPPVPRAEQPLELIDKALDEKSRR